MFSVHISVNIGIFSMHNSVHEISDPSRLYSVEQLRNLMEQTPTPTDNFSFPVTRGIHGNRSMIHTDESDEISDHPR